MRVMAVGLMTLCGCAQILGIDDPVAREEVTPDGDVEPAPDAGDAACTPGPLAVLRDDPPVVFLVDRTASMESAFPGGSTRWGTTSDQVVDAAARFDDLVRFGAAWFTTIGLDNCVDMYGLAPILDNGTGIENLLAGVAPDGSGGPFGAVIDTGVDVLGGPGALVMLTDSTASACAEGGDPLTETYNATLAASAAGVDLRVIAIGDDTSDLTLQAIRDAGGTATRADDAGELDAAFVELLDATIGCEFRTEPALDTVDADQLTVRWRGAPLTRDSSDGWRVVDDELVLTGAACDGFRAREPGDQLVVERACP